MSELIKFDSVTDKWFKEHPLWQQATVTKCPECGLYYKESLGHICEIKEETK